MTLAVPVILCGGTGTRLWPASREHRPKQLLALITERTLLQDTALRALKLCPGAAQRLITVTAAALAEDVTAQLAALDPALTRHILPEPAARDTGAAVALAALHAAAAFGPDALLLILPADHHIADEAALAEAVRRGTPSAAGGALITFGIAPTRPDTGYGYIKAGPARAGQNGVHAITQFVEKPDAGAAQNYCDAGAYLWNSGMFLARADVLLTQFRLHAPDILAATDAAVKTGGTACPDPALYAAIPALPFDKAVMEKSSDGAVVPCDPGWSDIGSWERLWDVRAKDAAGNACRGDVVTEGASDCLIESLGGRVVACAGIRNIVVVDTGDTVLVADRTDTAAVQALVHTLRQRKRA
jgi:mannose-1-phosphate guanylyltransferase/mannose-6-phosphate isomerase